MKNQAGFTLIELVVVIVILGILAATALPRFVNLGVDARRAAVQGIAGGLRSAVALSQARFFVDGTGAATIAMNGVNVAVTIGANGGMPTGTFAGIGTAMSFLSATESGTGVDVDYSTATAVTFRPDGSTLTTCQASYDGTSGLVSVDVSIC